MRPLPLAAAALPAALLIAAAPTPAQHPLATYADAFEARRAADAPVVSYVVHIDPREPYGYTVEMTVRHAPERFAVTMPLWAPGAYRVVNFGRYVRDVDIRRAPPATGAAAAA